MKKSLSEAEAQERLAELLNGAGLLWCAVPNGESLQVSTRP